MLFHWWEVRLRLLPAFCERTGRIEFGCSGMWKAYLKVVDKKAAHACLLAGVQEQLDDVPSAVASQRVSCLQL